MISAVSLETQADREGGREKQRAVKRRRRREVQVGSLPVISALPRARMDCRVGQDELQWKWPTDNDPLN